MAFECTRYLIFQRAECNTEYYLVVAKVRERLAVSNQTTQKFYVKRYKLRKLSKPEDRKQYQIKISNSLKIWRT